MPPTFQTIDNPADPTFNQLLGINDDGTIVGDFGSGAVGHPNKAYASASPYKTFAALNFPGAVTTRATGIGDDGSISGFWSATSGLSGANYGFVDWNAGSSGVFLDVSVNDPLVSGAPPVDQILSFNHSVAVGVYNDANAISHGFAYSVKTGVFTAIDIAGAMSVVATAMSESGVVCGYFKDSSGKTAGFLKPLAGGSPLVIEVPGSTTTEFMGVSGYGAVGFYTAANGTRHGLLYNITTKTLTTIDDPNGNNGTTISAIDDSRQAVGYYKDGAGNTHGMLVENI